MTRIITDQFSIQRISPLVLVYLLPLCGTLANRSVETFRWESIPNLLVASQCCTKQHRKIFELHRGQKTYMLWLSTVKLMASQYLTDILTLSIFQKRYEKKSTNKHTWDTHPSITTSVPQHKVAMPPRQRSFWAWHWIGAASGDKQIVYCYQLKRFITMNQTCRESSLSVYSSGVPCSFTK